jgi:TatD DNase family protein
MIDTHAHIDTEAFDADRDEVLKRAFDAGVEAIIVPDITPAAREHLKQVVDQHDRLFRGVGIHPHHAGQISHQDIDNVEAQCNESKVVAIGEIGLDYFYDFCAPDVQKLYFREQLRIAKSHDLPVIIHNRDADQDVLDILEQEQDGSLRGVLHCFSSDQHVLDRALSLGMHVSFTGNITFKKFTLREVVERVPVDRFMIETDSPYMTPVPHRGKRNEPSYVRLVAEKIAEIRSMTFTEVQSATTATAKGLFRLALLLACTFIGLQAQPRVPNEDDFERDSDYEYAMDAYSADSAAYERLVKPRTLGFGITLGSNTITERRTFRQLYQRALGENVPMRWREVTQDTVASFSYPSLSALGATIAYQLTPRFLFEGTYLYTKNEGERAAYNLPPIVTNIAELSMLYALNPYNKVNFLPQTGVTYAHTNDGITTTSRFGVIAGIGAGVSIPTSFGTFYPMVNVRFDIIMGTQTGMVTSSFPVIDGEISTRWFNPNGLPRDEALRVALEEGRIQEDPAKPGEGVYLHRYQNPATGKVSLSQEISDVTTIYAVPRLTLLFYPKF